MIDETKCFIQKSRYRSEGKICLLCSFRIRRCKSTAAAGIQLLSATVSITHTLV